MCEKLWWTYILQKGSGKMNELYHHGVKGQKWGVRRTPEQLGHKNKKIPNALKLENYKGKLYFISENDIDGETLIPRIPKNFLTEHGYEDKTIPRICFSDDPGKCLTALSQNVKGKTFYVYEPDNSARKNLYKPNSKAVPDQAITNEMWVTQPVKINRVGSIYVVGDDGKDGMKYSYGNGKIAELYGWNYIWNTDKLSHSNIEKGRAFITSNLQLRIYQTHKNNSKR